jgi:hypothetical protein
MSIVSARYTTAEFNVLSQLHSTSKTETADTRASGRPPCRFHLRDGPASLVLYDVSALH